MEIVYTLNALTDLDQIKEWLTETADRETAVRFVEQLRTTISDTLSVFPYGGSRRDDLPEGLRIFVYRRRWVALYWVDEDAQQVVIEGVTRGSRDRGNMFK